MIHEPECPFIAEYSEYERYVPGDCICSYLRTAFWRGAASESKYADTEIMGLKHALAAIIIQSGGSIEVKESTLMTIENDDSLVSEPNPLGGYTLKFIKAKNE